MTDGTTGRYDDGEVLSGCPAPEAVDTGREGPDRRGDIPAGDRREQDRSAWKVLTRPACPPALAGTADPEDERARAIRHFEDDGRRDGFKFKFYAVKAVRTALGDMTGGRCTYCEAHYDSTAPQDVEHYRPKGCIDTPQGKRKPGY